jgi:hypothetical protein
LDSSSNFELARFDLRSIHEREFLPDLAVAIGDQDVRIRVCAYLSRNPNLKPVPISVKSQTTRGGQSDGAASEFQ